MRNFLTIVAVLGTVLVSSAACQVVALQGGDATLLDAAGASAKFYFPASTLSISGGVYDGHIIGSFTEQRTWHSYDAILGDSPLSFPLPTNFTGSTGLYTRGLSLRRSKDKFDPDSDGYMFFAGVTAVNYFAPMFSGLKMSTPTGIFSYRKHLSKHFIFDSFNSVGTFKQSSIQTFSYVPVKDLRLSAAGGLGANSPYGAILLDYKRSSWLHLRTSYTESGHSFQQIILPLHQYATENSGLNASAELRPVESLNFQLYHQNVLSDFSGIVSHASINGFSAFKTFGALSFDASFFQSTSGGRSTHGETFGSQLTLGPVRTTADILLSQFGVITMQSVTEKITHHFQVSQFISERKGSVSASFGGDYVSNLFSAGLGWQEEYNPFVAGTSPFVKVMSAHISVQLSRGYSATVQTLTLPNGGTKFLAYGGMYVNGPMAGSTFSGAPHSSSGKYTVFGTVLDPQGQPVENIAVKIGKDTLYTDDHGRFEFHTNKNKSLPMQVDLDSSTADGNWETVSCPTTAAPGQEASVVVKRK